MLVDDFFPRDKDINWHLQIKRDIPLNIDLIKRLVSLQRMMIVIL